ncbi:TetR family transcriptional regulator [Streptomyces sp. 15-116A]|uniref:TetR/AcrR family transcriptional regulator n=1 Tax=Streptomyces sp. 15-116A TaxID=2259035 RepID=UPI0021B1BCC2|nr:TetR family transcriptional regulator [Streptomyces sp. 15-116A]MCT7351113.1 TetR family transcriptional regulator [Streptomyces sp. 15-116A]
MTFRRARTDEQRGQRRRQILDTAAAMLTEMPVAKLSLNELSRRVGLAKANVLRYFDSREAILLDLLDTEIEDWIAELARLHPADESTARERGDRLADILAGSMASRPVLCDLLAAQGAVLEHNISAETAVQHKHAARASLHNLTALVQRHVPELGTDGAAALVETVLLMAMTAWQCSRPSDAMLAAYASDPALAAMRMDFSALVRRTAAVTASGLLARQDTPDT